MPLLNFELQGSGPTLVWLHGFTQTRESAHQFRSILAGTHELLAVDLPGHGESSHVRASLERTAELVAACLPESPVALGGYSMGARVALHVALAFPERISALVVLAATRGINDDEQRLARIARDEALATRLEKIGVEAFLDEWLAQPMFASLPKDPAERQARSDDLDGLASSLRLCGMGTQKFLGRRLGALAMPVLCLAGELDDKFSDEANAIATGAPRAQVRLVANAQHAAHLEEPVACARLVTAFLDD